MSDQNENDFVQFLLDKSKKKEETLPQSRTGAKGTANAEQVEDALKAIREKIQKSK